VTSAAPDLAGFHLSAAASAPLLSLHRLEGAGTRASDFVQIESLDDHRYALINIQASFASVLNALTTDSLLFRQLMHTTMHTNSYNSHTLRRKVPCSASECCKTTRTCAGRASHKCSRGSKLKKEAQDITCRDAVTCTTVECCDTSKFLFGVSFSRFLFYLSAHSTAHVIYCRVCTRVPQRLRATEHDVAAMSATRRWQTRMKSHVRAERASTKSVVVALARAQAVTSAVTLRTAREARKRLRWWTRATPCASRASVRRTVLRVAHLVCAAMRWPRAPRTALRP
jgi:hypothetical protein